MKLWDLERAAFVFLVAGVGFFLFAFVGLGLAPWAQVDKEIDSHPPKELTPLTPLQVTGRKIYMKNGCNYCHSQFVRDVGDDPLRYGPASKAWEYSQQYPQLFGTRRIGPDLTREGGVHSDRWQYVHLYDPRMIAPWSIMPKFPWLFDGSPAKPTREAKALVAYLQSLGKARQEHMAANGGTQKKFIPGIGTVVQYTYRGGTLSDPGYDKVIYFEKVKRPLNSASLRAHGARLYQGECASCHGTRGLGNGPAAPYLQPTPERLAAFRYDPDFLYKVLYYGRPGTAMPSWVHSFNSFLSPKDLWALTYYLTDPHFYRHDQPATDPPAKTAALMQLGKNTFAAQCSACHGPHGGGDGPAATALSPAPVNFRGMQPAVPWAFHLITKGRPGTSMPPFASLPEKTRWALAYYVNALFAGDKRGAKLTDSATPGTLQQSTKTNAAADTPSTPPNATDERS